MCKYLETDAAKEFSYKTFAVGNISHRRRVVEITGKSLAANPQGYRIRMHRGKMYVWVTNSNYNKTSGKGFWVSQSKASVISNDGNFPSHRFLCRHALLEFLLTVGSWKSFDDISEGLSSSKFSKATIKYNLTDLESIGFLVSKKVPKNKLFFSREEHRKEKVWKVSRQYIIRNTSKSYREISV